jgi:hypothetical protein
MSQQYFEKKIFLSQYCVQKYCVWRRPKNDVSKVSSYFAVITRGLVSSFVSVVQVDGMVVHEWDGRARRVRWHCLGRVLQGILLVIGSANLEREKNLFFFEIVKGISCKANSQTSLYNKVIQEWLQRGRVCDENTKKFLQCVTRGGNMEIIERGISWKAVKQTSITIRSSINYL